MEHLSAFAVELTLDRFPPTVELIEAHLGHKIQGRVLQWAITQANPQTLTVHVEGAVVSLV